jgi:hypothetical protein
VVGVTVAGTFPSSAIAGLPVKMSGLHTTVVFPPAAAAGLRRLGVTRVTGRSVLSAAVADNAKAATALWPGHIRKPAPLAARGRVHLTFSGAAPSVTPSTPGMLTFTADELALSISRAASGAVNLASVDMTCTLAPGQDAKLAAVPVTAAATHPSHLGGGSRAKGRAAPGGGKVPPGCAKLLTPHPFPGQVLGCAHLLGYADVLKLQGAGLVGPAPSGTPPAAFLHVDSYGSDIGCVPKAPTIAKCLAHHGVIHVYTCSIAQLDYQKRLEFPPAEATFLNFGFVPVTAVLQLAETTWPASNPPVENRKCYTGFNMNKPVPLTSPVVTVFSDLNDSSTAGFPVLSISETYLTIHISQVRVNGVPLDVGSDCGTAEPVHAVLVGRGHNGPPPTGYTLDNGGPLTGNVTIPQFTHCGVGENIDALFDAGISGPGNFQLMTQGTLCTPQQSGKPGCPPTVPKPLRHVKS